MSDNYATTAITPDQLKEVILLAIQEQSPLMIWGPVGVGKSQIAMEAAADLGHKFHDIRALLLDPVDLRGLPYMTNGVTRWAPPTFLPPENSKGNFLVLLDEVTAAPPSIQASLYQLVQDRKVGEYTLPPGSAVIAASNRAEDLGVSNRMPAPLANKMVHVTVRPEANQWLKWALTKKLAFEVAMFIQFRPSLLHHFDAEAYRSGEVAFPSPRTWERVAHFMEATMGGTPVRANKKLFQTLVFGAVGAGAGSEFLTFLEIFQSLPPLPAILASPSTAPIPEEPSAQIAVCGALVRLATKDNLWDVFTYVNRLRGELRQFCLTVIQSSKPELQYTEAYTRWTMEETV